MTPYAQPNDADAYFLERLNVAAWTNASSDDKLRALKQSTRAIDRLNFVGEKHDDAQSNQFPRGDDTVVPQDIVEATCELALVLLDGVDPNFEMENLQNASQGIGDAKVTRDTSYTMDHVRNGIPSIQAWMILLNYLRDFQHPRLTLDRGN